MADKSTFSGEVSFHRMLQRAQEYDPVLTYWVCRWIRDRKDRDHNDVYVSTERIHRRSKLESLFACVGGTLEQFVEAVFRNSIMRVSGWGTLGSDDEASNHLYVRTEFAIWLDGLNLTFDDKKHLVTIPG